ncbi:uncharacterized protein [Diabrotica undecimpunctata]|uniref:uncharacterized protein n=1 Tax=Diabrotica undecimpunctata TaxID=50387 RepID=UPI003B63E0AE
MSQQRHSILFFEKLIAKLAAVRELFDQFVGNSKIHYIPSQHLTVDEKLESFRGRLSFFQYIPNKPANGLKVFTLVDSKTYYCINMKSYVGTQPEGPFRQSNNPQNIVERLIGPVSGTKPNINFDNWFTSYPLMANLLQLIIFHRLGQLGRIKGNFKQHF